LPPRLVGRFEPMRTEPCDTDVLLERIRQGDAHAAEQLLPLVYTELRRLAAQKLAQEQPGQTLQATALVHEAYLRLVGDAAARNWDGRGHFFAAAAEAMRRILVEKARRKRRRKHGGARQPPGPEGGPRPLETPAAHRRPPGQAPRAAAEPSQPGGRRGPQGAALVKPLSFPALPLKEAARALGTAERTPSRAWAYARAWLARFLAPPPPPADKT